MYPAWTAEVGLEVAPRQVDRELLALDRGGAGAQLGEARLRLRLQRGEVAGLRPQREASATDGLPPHLAADEARELGLARLDLGLLPRAELLEARDLELGPEHVLLGALAHGVARAGDALGLLRDLLLLAQHSQRLLGEDEAPEGPAYAGRDRPALALQAFGGRDGVARGDLLAQGTLAGPRQRLAAHEGERRHVALAEARAPAVRHQGGRVETRLRDRGLDLLVRREQAEVVDPIPIERR